MYMWLYPVDCGPAGSWNPLPKLKALDPPPPAQAAIRRQNTADLRDFAVILLSYSVSSRAILEGHDNRECPTSTTAHYWIHTDIHTCTQQYVRRSKLICLRSPRAVGRGEQRLRHGAMVGAIAGAIADGQACVRGRAFAALRTH